MLASIGWPVLDRFRFGSTFALSPHGLGIAIGFLIGSAVLVRIAPPRFHPDSEIDVDDPEARAALMQRRAEVRANFESMLGWALVGTIIGSRLAYVIAHYSDFNGFGDMLAVWKGGISLLGGIAGAIIINIPRIRRLHYGMFRTLDPAVVCIALGIAIGRIGDLLIGDHLGKPTSWLLAWTYHGGTLPGPWVQVGPGQWAAQLSGGYLETFSRAGAELCKAPLDVLTCQGQDILARGVGVHQTALYDMISAWLLFALLWTLQKKERRLGILTLTFGLWYGVSRLIEDSVRIDKRFFGLTGSQWTALVVAILSATTLIVWAIRGERAKPDEVDQPPPEVGAVESSYD